MEVNKKLKQTPEEFEIDCCNYLNKHLGEYFVFEHCGGNNSNIPDIKTKDKNTNKYLKNIEVKKCGPSKDDAAQSGQFVVLNDEKGFVFSKKNKTKNNNFSKKIIEYMNLNFDEYNKYDKSLKIPLENDNIFNDDIFFKWVKDHYENYLNSPLMILGDYKIIKTAEIEKFLSISAVYRAKKSGSNKLGKKIFDELKPKIITILKNYGIEEVSLYENDTDRLKVKLPIQNKNFIFKYKDSEYLLGNEKINGDYYIYEIRKRSKTKNRNVIFTIKPKDNFSDLNGLSLDKVIFYLKS